MRVKISTVLEAPPPLVWQALQQFATLQYVTRGVLGIRPIDDTFLEEMIWQAGESVTVRLYAFHLIPLWQHHLQIQSVDQVNWHAISQESGGPVTEWVHTITLETRNGDETTYTDIIDIKAGLLTPFIALFAMLFYRYRQMRWRGYAKQLVNRQNAITN